MKTTLRINGMDCAACAPKLAARLEKLRGIRSVQVNYAASRCTIEYDEAALTLDGLHRAVRRAGFDLPLETVELECSFYDANAAAKALGSVFGVKSAVFNY